MNLPSIFKSPSDMKAKPPTNSTSSSKPQELSGDMFGLGIQVFKIDSKSDALNNGSVGKTRNNMKKLENPPKMPSGINSQAKRISGKLPQIGQEQEKSEQDLKIRTNPNLSKKKIQKRISSINKVESIKQVLPKKETAVKNQTTSKNKPSKNNNKTYTHTPPPPPPPATQPQQTITKISYIQSLNQLPHFYSEHDIFQSNALSKGGRKKNMEYLGDCQDFISAYTDRQSYFYQKADKDDGFDIWNYDGDKGFEQIYSYQNHKVETMPNK